MEGTKNVKENHHCQHFNRDMIQIMRFRVKAYLKMSGPNKTWECLHWKTITSLEPIIWVTSKVYCKRCFTYRRDNFAVKVNYNDFFFNLTLIAYFYIWKYYCGFLWDCWLRCVLSLSPEHAMPAKLFFSVMLFLWQYVLWCPNNSSLLEILYNMSVYGRDWGITTEICRIFRKCASLTHVIGNTQCWK